MSRSALEQVMELQRMDVEGLKQRWQALFATEPPLRNRAHLIKRLAYRIQELAYGGLAEATRAQLKEIAIAHEQEASRPKSQGPVAGTRLVREWQGQRHEVTVTRAGYEYRGQPYKSLSAIARSITGTRWSGPVFFGLRKQEQAA